MSIQLLSLCTVLIYTSALGVLIYQLFLRKHSQQGNKTLFILLTGVALLLHYSLLYSTILRPDGLLLDIFNMFSLISALMVSIVLFALLRRPMENLALALIPLAISALILRLLMVVPAAAVIRDNKELELHILLSVVAFSLLSIAAVQALLLAIQERHLRNHQPSGFIRLLPPMESMELMLFQAINVGFVLLTLALFNGLMTLEDMFAQHLVHKTVLSLIAWLIFATLVWGRWRFGWRGRTAIRWTLTGLATLVLAYFGSKIVLELILHR